MILAARLSLSCGCSKQVRPAARRCGEPWLRHGTLRNRGQSGARRRHGRHGDRRRWRAAALRALARARTRRAGNGLPAAGARRAHREIFRDDRRPARPAASPSPRSTGAGRAAPTAGCATAARGTSTASTNTTAISKRSCSRWCCPIASRRISRWPIRPAALVCLRATRSGQARFSRLVLVSPLVGLGSTRPSQANVFRIAAFMTAIGFGEMTVPGEQARPIEKVPFEGNLLTGDAARYQRTIDIVTKLPQVSVGAPTFGWLYAACRAMRDATDPDFGPAIRVPSLVVSGALDRLVSLPAVEALAAALRAGRPGAHSRRAPRAAHGARHASAQQFWAAFDAFVPGFASALAAGEFGDDRLVQARVAAGHHAPAAGGGVALPVGHPAAGAGDDRDQRDDVIGLEPGLDRRCRRGRRRPCNRRSNRSRSGRGAPRFSTRS